MPEIETIFVLLAAVAALATLASRIGVPYPILLVLGGLVLGFVPGLPRIELQPNVVFLLFLPPLLYISAIFTSWRDFRRHLPKISLLAVGLVLVTVCAVAVVAHWAVGLPWGAAFVLGAIVSPTDAVAATAIAERLGIPRRIVTILEGESLINDATGIVAYRVAVAAVAAGTFSLWQAGLQFVIGAVGGVTVGLAVGWLSSSGRAATSPKNPTCRTPSPCSRPSRPTCWRRSHRTTRGSNSISRGGSPYQGCSRWWRRGSTWGGGDLTSSPPRRGCRATPSGSSLPSC